MARRRADTSRLELSRKPRVFAATAVCNGVAGRATRVLCSFLAPNTDDPSRLDMVTLSGYVGFRRLRPRVALANSLWCVRGSASGEAARHQFVGSDRAFRVGEEMDSRSCSRQRAGNLPLIEPVDTPQGPRLSFSAKVRSATKARSNCFWGEGMRQGPPAVMPSATVTSASSAPRSPRPLKDSSRTSSWMNALTSRSSPEVLVFGKIFAHGRPTGDRDDPSLLPIDQTTVELPGSPPLVNTPLVSEVFAGGESGLRADETGPPERFRGTRLIMEYPPLGSDVILRFPPSPQIAD